MSEFISRLEWKRDHPDFEIKTFNRNHRIHFPNGALLEGSSAPDYSGDPEKITGTTFCCLTFQLPYADLSCRSGHRQMEG